MMNNVTGSIMFSIAFPDFCICHMCSAEPALLCEKQRVPVVELPILIFYGKCQPDSVVLGSEHKAYKGQPALKKFVSDCLVRNIYTNGLLEINLQGSGSIHHPSACTKEKIPIPANGLRTLYGPIQLSRVTVCLLKSSTWSSPNIG